MRNVYLQICDGKMCSENDSQELMTLPSYLTDRENDALTLCVVPCLEHCQVLTENHPPFVVINDATYGEMTLDNLISIIKKMVHQK